MQKISKTHLKRGDTIIEVTIAFAIFSLVAIITVAMMNLGIATSERSLELVTARSEINAQAEAIRFIYNAYISESKLPECDGSHYPCQKYKELWERITNNAISSGYYKDNIPETPETCNDFYNPAPGGSSSPLRSANAFVINARKLAPDNSKNALNPDNVYFGISSHADAFQPSPLSSRILYTSGSKISDEQMQSRGLASFTEIARAEGIWVIAVQGDSIGSRIPFYDFYIRSCWYGSNSPTYSSLDSVIRLYNAY